MRLAMGAGVMGASPSDLDLVAPPPPPSPSPAVASAAEPPWARLVDDALEVRVDQARGLAQASGAWVPAALWLVAWDPSAQVRALGLQAVQARCPREPGAMCARLLSLYVQGPDPELGALARQALLPRDLEAALDGASRAYKEDLLARLGADASLVDASSRRLLRRLSVDDDPQVQDCASWLLER